MMRLGWIVLIVGVLLGISGCGGEERPVQIRVRNETGARVTEVWIGSTGGDSSPMIGPVEDGATSAYQGFGSALPNYRQIHIVLADGRRFLGVVDPEAQFGARDLAPGSYTFVLSTGEEPVPIEMIRD